MNYKFFPNININLESIDDDMKLLIREIKPLWDPMKLKITKMFGGVSNLLFGVFFDDYFIDGETDMILVRVYGNLLLDRNMEIVNMVELSKHDLAAHVWGQFSNGCCYQFVHGSLIDYNLVRDPQIYKLIIPEFVKLHSAKLNLVKSKEPFLFKKMREAAFYLPLCLDNSEKNDIYLSEYPNKEKVFKEIDELEMELIGLNCPIKFCHNDLLLKNMILNIKRDRIHMIDFEYADYNYCAFDIGNHFCEFAGLDDPDYSLYPDKSFQMVWLRLYLEEVRLVGGNESPVEVEEVEQWYSWTNKFALVFFHGLYFCGLSNWQASHLLWSIWSIWQEMNSCISFDYLKFGIVRWNEYLLRKHEFLAL